MTYLSDQALKTAFLEEIGKHEAADQLVKGNYGYMNGLFKGCAIGCSLHSLNLIHGKPDLYETGNHRRMMHELGWPLWLAYIADTIFEGLPDALSATWPRRLAEAISVGIRVPEIVLAKVMRWILLDAQFGMVSVTESASAKTSVLNVGALFDRVVKGDIVPEQEWAEAGAAAGAVGVAVARASIAAWEAGAWAADEASLDAAPYFYPALSEELIRLLKDLEEEMRLSR